PQCKRRWSRTRRGPTSRRARTRSTTPRRRTAPHYCLGRAHARVHGACAGAGGAAHRGDAHERAHSVSTRHIREPHAGGVAESRGRGG
ncbi:hypothetical protein FB451DRAFT_1568486, partial [Mycena latifolia]